MTSIRQDVVAEQRLQISEKYYNILHHASSVSYLHFWVVGSNPVPNQSKRNRQLLIDINLYFRMTLQ